jgi:hypothetical protein
MDSSITIQNFAFQFPDVNTRDALEVRAPDPWISRYLLLLTNELRGRGPVAGQYLASVWEAYATFLATPVTRNRWLCWAAIQRCCDWLDRQPRLKGVATCAIS